MRWNCPKRTLANRWTRKDFSTGEFMRRVADDTRAAQDRQVDVYAGSARTPTELVPWESATRGDALRLELHRPIRRRVLLRLLRAGLVDKLVDVELAVRVCRSLGRRVGGLSAGFGSK